MKRTPIRVWRKGVSAIPPTLYATKEATMWSPFEDISRGSNFFIWEWYELADHCSNQKSMDVVKVQVQKHRATQNCRWRKLPEIWGIYMRREPTCHKNKIFECVSKYIPHRDLQEVHSWRVGNNIQKLAEGQRNNSNSTKLQTCYHKTTIGTIQQLYKEHS